MDANGRNNSGMSLKFTRRSTNNICDWMNLCRNIHIRIFKKRQPFRGSGQIVQIDECLMRDTGKNNRERFRLTNLKSAVIPRQEDEEDTNRNYGRRVGGPWVVGFFVIGEKKNEKLHQIIKNVPMQ
ncbi:Hypothetical protein CINCED_3A002471 [Cinara cedri]|uniref:Uncharacterized protein n=1 Tax=Cinara cedri TaxID=506608 RepID=A0A5E4N2C4_9HEMI|nr:Hypothetical protein CINCED_3A002471 [Cinara cedri]